MSRRSAERRIEKARALEGADQTQAFYRDWASSYDVDIAGELKFIGPARIAEVLANHVADKTAPVIDLGCGTGLVGEAMTALGFTGIDGLDLSPDMLEVARAKGVYREMIEADLLAPLAIPAGTYSAAVSAGTFTTGHVDASALPEIARIIRPGGIVACVIADAFWHTGGFAKAMDDGPFEVVHESLEPIVEGGPPQGRYVVLRL